MKPYYEHGGVTIYHGDCREIIPNLTSVDVILTDPVWPNSIARLAGAERPYELFKEVAEILNGKRLSVHLGCDSDPRFLAGIPSKWKFFRACWLDLSRPHYKGRLLAGAEVAYLFGEPPKSSPGRHIIPGMMRDHAAGGKETAHPCPRKIGHTRWLVDKWSSIGEVILDPFSGGGTTLRAAKDCNRVSIGIDIDEEFCEIAAKYMGQESLALI